MRVCLVSYAIELQVDQSQPGRLGRATQLRLLREANAVASALHTEVPDLACVLHGPQKMRAQSRLAAGELDAHLTP